MRVHSLSFRIAVILATATVMLSGITIGRSSPALANSKLFRQLPAFLTWTRYNLRLEVDTMNTAAALPAMVQRDGRINSLENIYITIGINIQVLHDQNIQDLHPGQGYTDAELQNLHLATMNQAPTNPNIWHVQALMLPAHVDPTIFGKMFTLNTRQGFAVFTGTIGDNPRILRTAAHELGHALNLFHSDGDGDIRCCQQQPNAPHTGQSIMNQTRCLATNWGYFFSAVEQAHLLTHPENRIRPASGFGFNGCIPGHTGTC